MKLVPLLLLSLVATSAEAQSRFVPDSISIEYAQCKGDSAVARVLLINRGSSLEILDLRFADSNRTWEIFDTSGTYTFIKGAVLFGGDTLKLRLRQRRIGVPGTEWYRDTLVTSGAATSDTLLLNSRILTSDLHTDLDTSDLGIVLQGATAAREFKVWNSGDAPHIFDYVLSAGWRLEGISVGDTLLPGDTVSARLVMNSTATIGSFSASLAIAGDCDALPTIRATVKIVPAHAYWVNSALIETVYGCDESRSFLVSIANGSSTATRIDSVQFIGESSPYWSFSSPDVFPAQIQPGEAAYFTLSRYPGATSTRLVIHSDKPGDDTLTVAISSMVTRPRIVNFIDTVIVNLAPDQDTAVRLSIQNQGPGLYHLTDYQLEGAPQWSVLGFDTITTIGQSKTIPVTLVFSGASAEGDFPAKILIQGAQCDTILSQVVIARVATLEMAEDLLENKIQIFPTLANDAVTIRTGSRVIYAIYDMLGNDLLSGVAEAPESSVDVSTLPAGSYYIKLSSGRSMTTKRIVIRR